MDDRELLSKRFLEQSRKADAGGYFIFTDFLGLAEQSVLLEESRSIPKSLYVTYGGAMGAERVMVRFGREDEIGYSEPFPITLIKIEPKSQKFADKLSHRDFLGSLMNLGLDRSAFGDIVIIDNVGYLFCKTDIAEYVISSLERVKHTDVRLSEISELPEGELFKTERRKIQAVGERVDAVVAKVFSISREESLSYFKKGLVFADGRLIENNSYVPKHGERISVRGLGRFIYLGYASTSKKGKLNIEVDIYV